MFFAPPAPMGRFKYAVGGPLEKISEYEYIPPAGIDIYQNSLMHAVFKALPYFTLLDALLKPC